MAEDTVRSVIGVGPVNFPDSMSPSAIDEAVARLEQNATAAAKAPPTPPPPAGTWDDKQIYHPTGQPPGRDTSFLGVPIHVPAEFQSSVTTSGGRPDTNVVGWGKDTAGVSPEDVLIGGAAVKRIAESGAAGGLMAAARAAAGEMNPYVKFEVAQHALRAAGIPDWLALPAAYYLSGRGAKTEATPKGTAPPPVRWPQEPAAAGPVAPPPIVYRQAPAGPAPTAPPPVRWPQEPAAAPTPPTVAPPPIVYRKPPVEPTAPTVAPPPVRWPPQAAAEAPVAPPPIVYRNTPVEPAPRPVAPPPIKWQSPADAPANTVGAFTPGQQASAAPAAAAPAAVKDTGSALAAKINKATDQLTAAGMSTPQANKTVLAWVRNGTTDLVGAAKFYVNQFLKP